MAIMNNFTSGGTSTDELTATPAEVMSGYKFIGANSDDISVGSLILNGNAVINHVMKNQTFYNNNLKQKLTGILEPNNISNFTVTVSSGRNITAKWTNPTQANGRPYSGVYIRYATGGYPTPTTGTQLYKGIGSNGNAGAVSQVGLTLPNLSTLYYLICYSYCITSNGELLGTQLRTTVNTGGTQIVTFKDSTSYTIPAGYTKMDVFAVGGGSSGGKQRGGSGRAWYIAGGGGAGRTGTGSNYPISAGQQLTITVGKGGGLGLSGGYSGVEGLFTVNGGDVSENLIDILPRGINGGSGGGGANSDSNGGAYAGAGGSNGGNGGAGYYDINKGGTGQGRTTKAFGEANGALYAGGGGGGAYSMIEYKPRPGAGGAGGGGAGGSRGNSQAGFANTGGGGGGGENGDYGATCFSAVGGSGIVLLRLK